jgi:hypothetical protein
LRFRSLSRTLSSSTHIDPACLVARIGCAQGHEGSCPRATPWAHECARRNELRVVAGGSVVPTETSCFRGQHHGKAFRHIEVSCVDT